MVQWKSTGNRPLTNGRDYLPGFPREVLWQRPRPYYLSGYLQYTLIKSHRFPKDPILHIPNLSLLTIVRLNIHNIHKHNIHFNQPRRIKSSHRWCSMNKGVLRTFAKFIGKHLYEGLFFNKVAGLRPATLLKKRKFMKKRLWHRCFPVNFTKFLRTPSL